MEAMKVRKDIYCIIMYGLVVNIIFIALLWFCAVN